MSCHRTIARAVIGIFVILLLAVPLLVIEAYAGGKGGGGGGGWGGGGRVAGRWWGGAHFRGWGVRSFGVSHVTTRSFSPSVARSAPFKISPAVGGGTHV